MALYEVATITFYCFMMGTADWTRVHEVAWAQDLVFLIWFFTVAILLVGFYTTFVVEEESSIPVKKYERPTHERHISRYEDNQLP